VSNLVNGRWRFTVVSERYDSSVSRHGLFVSGELFSTRPVKAVGWKNPRCNVTVPPSLGKGIANSIGIAESAILDVDMLGKLLSIEQVLAIKSVVSYGIR
jgi:hypothetical protein